VFKAFDWNHVTNHIVNLVCCLNLNKEAILISPFSGDLQVRDSNSNCPSVTLPHTLVQDLICSKKCKGILHHILLAADCRHYTVAGNYPLQEVSRELEQVVTFLGY
jgi:hypothetical protein